MKFLIMLICVFYSSLSFSMDSSVKKEISNRWKQYLISEAHISCSSVISKNCISNQMSRIEKEFLDLKDINSYIYNNPSHNLVGFFYDRAKNKHSPKINQEYYQKKLISLIARVSVSAKEFNDLGLQVYKQLKDHICLQHQL